MKKFSSLFLANLLVVMGVFISICIQNDKTTLSLFFDYFLHVFVLMGLYTFGAIFILMAIDYFILLNKHLKKWIMLELCIYICMFIVLDKFNYNKFFEYWYYTLLLIMTQYIKYKIYSNFSINKVKNEGNLNE